MIAFGPVPSRRLGRSLGINHIPPKTCSYGCVYCQVGRTTHLTIDQQEFYAPDIILDSVSEKLHQLERRGESVDYLTFVADGEPTLDRHLGRTTAKLKALGRPVAVISNASLVWDPEVRTALNAADWVSLKVDTVMPRAWRRINRPHRELELKAILDGVLEFSKMFAGHFVTETMLVAGINDDPEGIRRLAAFLAAAAPKTAYLAIPTRPPCEKWVRPPDETALHDAYRIVHDRLNGRVEYLIAYEGNAFYRAGQPEAELVNILAVHPMREDAVLRFLEGAGDPEACAETMVQQGLMRRVAYGDQWYYVRRLHRTGQCEP